jgi:hypothetical protein
MSRVHGNNVVNTLYYALTRLILLKKRHFILVHIIVLIMIYGILANFGLVTRTGLLIAKQVDN